METEERPLNFEDLCIFLGKTLKSQRDWSFKTFGSQPRVEGLLKHIESEIEEVRAKPDDVVEWTDIMALAFDGAIRQGYSVQYVLEAWISKMMEVRLRNYLRTPDNEPSFHSSDSLMSTDSDTNKD